MNGFHHALDAFLRRPGTPGAPGRFWLSTSARTSIPRSRSPLPAPYSCLVFVDRQLQHGLAVGVIVVVGEAAASRGRFTLKAAAPWGKPTVVFANRERRISSQGAKPDRLLPARDRILKAFGFRWQRQVMHSRRDMSAFSMTTGLQ
jgi:hypothetical protein